MRFPYGIIFADLNGLKICNDTKGHKAGDELLKKAAALLKEIFNEDEIYRSGGDEAMYEDKRKYYEAHPEFKTRHE